MVPKVFEPLKFYCISVILGRQKGDYERLNAKKSRLDSDIILPLRGLELATPRSESGSAHHFAIQTLLHGNATLPHLLETTSDDGLMTCNFTLFSTVL